MRNNLCSVLNVRCYKSYKIHKVIMIKLILTFFIGLALFALIPSEYIPSFFKGLHKEADKVTTPVVDKLKTTINRPYNP